MPAILTHTMVADVLAEWHPYWLTDAEIVLITGVYASRAAARQRVYASMIRAGTIRVERVDGVARMYWVPQ